MHMAKICWWAAVVCLGATVGIWFGFLLMRLNPGQSPSGPWVARLLLGSLFVSVLAPVGAAVFSSLALLRPPRALANWVVFALSWMMLFVVAGLFLLTRMM